MATNGAIRSFQPPQGWFALKINDLESKKKKKCAAIIQYSKT